MSRPGRGRAGSPYVLRWVIASPLHPRARKVLQSSLELSGVLDWLDEVFRFYLLESDSLPTTFRFCTMY